MSRKGRRKERIWNFPGTYGNRGNGMQRVASDAGSCHGEAMTEGLFYEMFRIFGYVLQIRDVSFTTPPSKIIDFCHLPLHRGGFLWALLVRGSLWLRHRKAPVGASIARPQKAAKRNRRTANGRPYGSDEAQRIANLSVSCADSSPWEGEPRGGVKREWRIANLSVSCADSSP